MMNSFGAAAYYLDLLAEFFAFYGCDRLIFSGSFFSHCQIRLADEICYIFQFQMSIFRLNKIKISIIKSASVQYNFDVMIGFTLLL